ncbi:MAG: PKD domain-containing protein, partial [Gemmatimonadota bacterium]|nr:PKD domain-containing protein [Gemmatimonadota bacterium]
TGAPLEGVELEWSFQHGGGASGGAGQPVQTFLATTDSLGQARIWWQLGTRAGAQSASVEIRGSAAGASPATVGAQAPGGRGRSGLSARGRPARPDSVSIAPGVVTLAVGDSVSLVGEVLDRYENVIENPSIAWTSTDESVAVPTSDGVVHSMSPGEALIVAESGGATGSVSVTAEDTAAVNQAPTANIDSPSSNVTVQVGAAVNFSGTASDSDGSIASHAWTFGDGSGSSQADPGAHAYSAQGTYTVTYRATDDDGLQSAPARRTITVNAGANQAPTATIDSPSGNVTVQVGAAVNFSGTASDSDGTVASHAWTFGDGSGSNQADPGAHSYSAEGSYTVTYRVTDNDGLQSAPATRTITVNAAANQAPTATIDSPSSNVTVQVGAAVNFSGTASDSDGTVASHAWTFGDGSGSSQADPGAHPYSAEGTYTVTYRATDNDGLQSAPATRTITVNAAPPNGGVVAEWYSLFEGSTWKDNGKWVNWAGGGTQDVAADQIFSIFTTSLDPDVPGGRGWRSQQVNGITGAMWQALNNTSGPSQPAVGEVTTWRHFTKIVNGDTDGNYHSVGFGSQGLSSSGADGGVWTWVGTGGRPFDSYWADADGAWWGDVALPNDEWLRFEYNWERLSSTTWNLQIRVYNEAGTLIADQEDWNAGNPGMDFPKTNSGITAATVTLMEIGVPGLGSVPAGGYEMERHAAFAAITDSVAHVNMPYGYFSHEN